MPDLPDFSPLESYLDAEGRLARWPSVKKKNRAMTDLALEYLVQAFEYDRVYTEREVNALLNEHHTFEDAALLRREMVMYGLMAREIDGSAYWRTDPDDH